MIRFIFTAIFILCSAGISKAQQITAAEYFFDNNDPGSGKANPISGNFPSDSITVSVSAPVTGLNCGVHALHVRCKDSSGIWWLYNSVLFTVEFGFQTSLSGAEVFAGNTDPGLYNATALSGNFPSDSLTVSGDISTSNLPIGVHFITVRAFDETGMPSMNERKLFSVIPDIKALLISGEYFIDTDPGVGRATPFSFPAGTQASVSRRFDIPLLGLGKHALYIRTKNAKGLWSHYLKKEFKVCTTYSPGGSFDADVKGNDVYFTSTTYPADSYYWDFGDSVTSAEGNPHHRYSKPGLYTVTHGATNLCGSDTHETQLIIKGIQSISPNRSDNDGFFRMEITGAGFDTGNSVSISLGGFIDVPVNTIVKDSAHIVAIFNFNEIPVGTYNVMIHGNARADTLPSALFIEDTSFYKLWVNVVAPEWIATEQYQPVRVAVGNSGNNYAFGVPVHLRFNAGHEAVMVTPINNSLTDSVLQINVPSQRFYSDLDSISPTRKDSSLFAGLMVNYIAPGSTVYIDFLIRAKTAGNLEVGASVMKPFYEGIALSNIGLRANCLFIPSCLHCALDIHGLKPKSACNSTFSDLGCKLAQGALKGESSQWWDLVGGMASTILQCADISPNILNNPKLLLRMGTDVVSSASQSATLTDPQTCPSCFDHITHKSPLQSVVSGVHNIKNGPVGFTAGNYISGNKPTYYRISFTNPETAPVTVKEVVVTDTVDSMVFDLTSPVFVGFGFGSTVVNLEDESDSFSYDIDLRPGKNTILRCRGWYETESHTLKAQYSSFDPTSMVLTDTADYGFLPPNKNEPEGEGFLIFRVAPKAGLSHQKLLNNEAKIYFDQDTLITTPVWVNTIDRIKPSGAVSLLPATIYDTTFTVSWASTDIHAGVMDHNIYVSENNGPYRLWKAHTSLSSAEFNGSFGKKYAFFSVARDHVLNQEDSTLIADATTTLAEPLDIIKLRRNVQNISINPNPASNEIIVQFHMANQGPAEVIVRTYDGRPVLHFVEPMQLQREKQLRISTADISPGIYILSVENAAGIGYRTFVVSR